MRDRNFILVKLYIQHCFSIYFILHLFTVWILATIPCATGYTLASSGKCVNLATDFNNCGVLDYVCSSNYTECINGSCAKTPTLQLVGGTTIFNSSSNSNLDDQLANITLPLNITLYSYSTSQVTVTMNGVSTVLIHFLGAQSNN